MSSWLSSILGGGSASASEQPSRGHKRAREESPDMESMRKEVKREAKEEAMREAKEEARRELEREEKRRVCLVEEEKQHKKEDLAKMKALATQLRLEKEKKKEQDEALAEAIAQHGDAKARSEKELAVQIKEEERLVDAMRKNRAAVKKLETAHHAMEVNLADCKSKIKFTEDKIAQHSLENLASASGSKKKVTRAPVLSFSESQLEDVNSFLEEANGSDED